MDAAAGVGTAGAAGGLAAISGAFVPPGLSVRPPGPRAGQHRDMGTLRDISSGALDGIGYDAETATLTVSFADGRTYEYYGVTRRLYERLLAAQPHPWSALGAEVRRHPYRRVDED